MSDSGLIKQGASFTLNQLQPALFSLGPVGVGLGAAFSFVTSFLPGLFGDDSLPPIPRPPAPMVIDAFTGSVSLMDTGEPVATDGLGVLPNWVLQLTRTIGRLLVFFSNTAPDFSKFTADIKFTQTATPVSWWVAGAPPGTTTGGMVQDITGQFSPVITPDYGKTWRGQWTTSWTMEISVGDYFASVFVGENGSQFDNDKFFYNVLRTVLVNSNVDMDAGIKTILESPASDKDAVTNAIAQRKIDVAAAKKQLADLKTAIADLQKKQATLAILQDYDLYMQEQQFLQSQIDAAKIQSDALSTVAENSVVASTAKPPVVPVLLLLGLLT